MRKSIWLFFLVLAAIVVVSYNTGSGGEENEKEVIMAYAAGTGTRLGSVTSITIHIEDFSTPDDQQVLLQAYKTAGNKGLFNAVSKMPSKGRIAITGTLGYDVNYIKEFPTANGRKIRIVTDRPISMGEAWTNSRSSDYNLTAVEIDVDGDKITGTLVPACMFKIDQDNQIHVEAYQNPWKLQNIKIKQKK